MRCGVGRRYQQGGREMAECVEECVIIPHSLSHMLRSVDTHGSVVRCHVGRRYKRRVKTMLAEPGTEFFVVPSFNNSE